MIAALDRLASLVVGQLEGAAEALAVRLRPRAAFARARPDQLALELRQPAMIPVARKLWLPTLVPIPAAAARRAIIA